MLHVRIELINTLSHTSSIHAGVYEEYGTNLCIRSNTCHARKYTLKTKHALVYSMYIIHMRAISYQSATGSFILTQIIREELGNNNRHMANTNVCVFATDSSTRKIIVSSVSGRSSGYVHSIIYTLIVNTAIYYTVYTYIDGYIGYDHSAMFF